MLLLLLLINYTLILYSGEITCYNIHGKRAVLVKKPKFEEAHNRIIFNICTYNYNIITTSLDKQVLIFFR